MNGRLSAVTCYLIIHPLHTKPMSSWKNKGNCCCAAADATTMTTTTTANANNKDNYNLINFNSILSMKSHSE